MINDTQAADVGRQYLAAYAAHYTTKQLLEALELYEGIIRGHPEAPEAGYARAQIQNIVQSVVPKEVLFDAQLELALVHAGQTSPPS
jgi:hypothetical protein